MDVLIEGTQAPSLSQNNFLTAVAYCTRFEKRVCHSRKLIYTPEYYFTGRLTPWTIDNAPCNSNIMWCNGRVYCCRQSLSIGTFLDPLSSVKSIDRLRLNILFSQECAEVPGLKAIIVTDNGYRRIARRVYFGRQRLSMKTFIDLLLPAMTIDR